MESHAKHTTSTSRVSHDCLYYVVMWHKIYYIILIQDLIFNDTVLPMIVTRPSHYVLRFGYARLHRLRVWSL